MAVRPFFIEADIEGRRTTLKGGPQRKDGEMSVSIYQRSKGEITTACTIKSYLEKDKSVVGDTPKLCTSIYDNNGDLIYEFYSEY